MTAHAYALSDAAEADLRAIIRYTRKQWGDAQVRDYIAKLDEGITQPFGINMLGPFCLSAILRYTGLSGNQPGYASAPCLANKQNR